MKTNVFFNKYGTNKHTERAPKSSEESIKDKGFVPLEPNQTGQKQPP